MSRSTLRKITTRNVATIDRKATIEEAARTMRDAHVGDLVVLDETRSNPVGILTDRDIVMSAVAFGIDPKSVLVEDAMSGEPVTAKQGDPFYHILNLMKEHGVRRIPMMNAKGELVGIISADDLIGLLADELGTLAEVTQRQHEVEHDRRRKIS